MGRLLGLVSLVPPTPSACASVDCDPAETRCLSPISATNLLSTSTPETHQLPRAWLSPRQPPRRPTAFPQHACAGFQRASFEVAPDSPKASPIPSDATIGVVAPAAVHRRSHLRRGHPFFWGGVSSRVGVLSLHASRTPCPLALPVALRRLVPLSRSAAMQSQEPPLRATHQGDPRPELEAPSTDRSLLPHPCWR
jgi:hypothetical protein